MEPKALESCLLSHQQKVYQGRYHSAFLTPKSDIERSCIAVENSKMDIIIFLQNLNLQLCPVSNFQKALDRQTQT